MPTNNRLLVKPEKSGCPGGNSNPCSVEFRFMPALDILPNSQSSKVGLKGKSEPAVSTVCSCFLV